ncbi:MAG: septal ring lytic transglycosylase RlpA family protein [Snowella sp.]|nr:septal ring lytic transglycosylase RlpA family protein [Snowella sp.]
MKKTTLSGLTPATLITSLGASFLCLAGLSGILPSYANTNPTHQDPSSQSQSTTESNTSTTASIQKDLTPTILAPASQENKAIADIYPHAWKDGRLAVTLRVKTIPIATFLGTVADLKAFADNPNPTAPEHPVVRAQAIAEDLNALAQDSSFKASDITVGVDKAKRTYQIEIEGEVLLTLDKNTILPDTTRNLSKDALQMANRLRRVMGDAPPLTSVAKIANPKFNPMENGTPTRRAIRGGIASWYGPGFHGRRTANGERYNQHGLTAAHRSLPFGTRVRVTNLRNGQSVTVRINDRGPFIGGRVIDLSAGAARAIGVYHSGTAPVQLEVMNF